MIVLLLLYFQRIDHSYFIYRLHIANEKLDPAVQQVTDIDTVYRGLVRYFVMYFIPYNVFHICLNGIYLVDVFKYAVCVFLLSSCYHYRALH